MGFTGFYWVLFAFTGFYWFFLDFTGIYWVLLGFSGLYWVLQGFYWVSLGFDCVQLGFTGFYWVPLGFTEFHRVLPVGGPNSDAGTAQVRPIDHRGRVATAGSAGRRPTGRPTRPAPTDRRWSDARGRPPIGAPERVINDHYRHNNNTPLIIGTDNNIWSETLEQWHRRQWTRCADQTATTKITRYW